jgi:diguanylate cyclase (GGDEF)-like protein
MTRQTETPTAADAGRMRRHWRLRAAPLTLGLGALLVVINLAALLVGGTQSQSGAIVGFEVLVSIAVAWAVWRVAKRADAAQADAAASSLRLASVLDTMGGGVVLWDAQSRLVLCNQDFRASYGLPAHELVVGRSFESLVRRAVELGLVPDARGREPAWIAERLALHAQPAGPMVRQTADGRWRRIIEDRFADGSVLSCSFDITEQIEKQTELAAARGEAERASTRLTDAIEALPDGFVLFDAEDRLVLCNTRYREIYRDSAPALVPGTRFEAILRYGVARGQIPQALGREEQWLAERLYQHRHPGPPMLQELAGNHWLRIGERLTAEGGVAGVRTDVTELVRREQELRRLNQQLDKANAQLELLSDTDGLTGIFNRRRYDRRLAEDWARWRRLGVPLAVVLIDVDHFKLYNDHHGHQAGDDALRRVAAALRQTTPRSIDLVARYGGEEFVLLLPGTDADGAMLIAQRCLDAVDAAAIEHARSPLATHLTLSIGVAVTRPEAGVDNADSLVGRADAALYRAKSEGRHRVVLG